MEMSSNFIDDERPVNEAALLGSGRDAETKKSPKAPKPKGNENIRLSGAAR